MLVDSHSHIYLDRFNPDRSSMLDRAREAGVGAIIMPAIDLPSIEKAVELSRQQAGLYAMAAIHPSETREASDVIMEAVAYWCDDPKVVAVGESGLDYYWDRSFDETQHQFLRRHIRLAIEKDLPLILHNREATDDLIQILREEREASAKPERLRGIFHCFGGPETVVRSAEEMGFLLGVGGTVTFKNSGVADLIKDIPLERIVLETDAPFLAPVPYRGKRNEPSYLRFVAEKVAEVKGVPLEDVVSITTKNAYDLFALDPSAPTLLDSNPSGTN